jgi:hypothetical protein
MALLALSDQGSPALDHNITGALTVFGIPLFARTTGSVPRPYVGGNWPAKSVGMGVGTENPTRLTNRRWGDGQL